MSADLGARIEHIRARLLPKPEPLDLSAKFLPDWMPEVPFDRPPVPAAVLIALLTRPEGLKVLFTERAASLRAHSGQVSFPGGKIDPKDEGPGAAALREAHEEVALDPEDAEILGYMRHYFTGTNYLITPVVALVRTAKPFVLNPREVTDIFEVPLARLALLDAYKTFRVSRNGVEHTTWQIDHEGHRIWGITANLTRRFRDLALEGRPAW